MTGPDSGRRMSRRAPQSPARDESSPAIRYPFNLRRSNPMNLSQGSSHPSRSGAQPFRGLTPTVAIVAFTVSLVAQSASRDTDTTAPAPAVAPQSAISQAFGAGHTDGVTWAAGPDYKAIFGRGTVEFTPALGAQAPHNLPVNFTLESIRRGEDRVFTAPPAEQRAVAQASGNTVRFERGAGIVERYDATADHLKQSFVFAQQPAGSGDLIVRLQLDTELEASIGQGLDGLRLDSQFGGVDIGAVVGVDAGGRRAKGSMNWDGRHLELVLSDSFVSNASYPLELDPPIGSVFPIGTLSGDDIQPDIAYGGFFQVYLVVWENVYSSSDRDVRAIRVLPSGSTSGSVLQVAYTSNVERKPQVGYNALRRKFFVAWQEDLVSGWEIQGRSIPSGSGSPDAKTLVTGGFLFDDNVEPDVSGELTLTSEDVYVVYRKVGSGIYGKPVGLTVGGGYSVQPFVEQTIASGSDLRDPSISKSARSAGGNRCVAWEDANGFDDLGARIIRRDGSPATDTVLISSTNSDNVANPEVDGDGDRFLIAYEQIQSSSGDIWAVDIFDSDPVSSTNPVSIGRKSIVRNSTSDDANPSVTMLYPTSWGSPLWLVTYGEGPVSGPHALWSLKLTGSPWHTCGPRDQTASGATDNTFNAVAAGANGSAMVVWSADEAQIDGRRWEAFAGGTVTQIPGAPGCGAGGATGTDGPASIGNQGFGITLSGADTNAMAAFWRADVTRQPLNAGCAGSTCRAIFPLVQAFIPLSGGSARWPLPLPCSPAFFGFEIDTQWIVISNAAGGCSWSPQLHASNAIRITLGN
ncbi:MAG: hypothetical protein NXI31_00795 [bacterium]|nr:hypothetical protein [bacterium]